ncbi:hypothetical protein [Cellulomonas sp. SLBN-39]|uniref:hypothetical protein n=1 Tax=Cellulomonas sp. SLBN-39 TaxID=2768446 RepID=UPI00114F6F38|nr:hypothetical protein [Cellulomonas sp. SLBN-39]
MPRPARSVVAVAALALAGCAPVAGAAVESSCAAPRVTASPETVAPGDSLTVTGEGYVTQCLDNPGIADGTPVPQPTDVGQDRVTVVWVQGSTTVDLAVADAQDDGAFEVVVSSPTRRRTGPQQSASSRPRTMRQ